MKFSDAMRWGASLCGVILLGPCGLAKDAAFEESFSDYSSVDSGDAPLSENWWFYSGNPPRLEHRLGEGTAQQLIVPNAVIARELAAPLDKNFSLTVSLLHSDFERRQWFGVFNDDLTAGYIVAWDSRTADQEGGRGVVSIRKVNSPEKKLEFLAEGDGLSEVVAAPAEATAVEAPFLALTLRWSAKDGELVLSRGDLVLARAADPALTKFRYVVIGGNDSAVVEQLQLKSE